MVLKRFVGALVAATVASVMAGALAGQPALASNPDTIVNYDGLCLQPVPDPFQNIVDDGVRIAQEACDSALSEQRWRSLQVGTSGGQPIYYLINQRSQKCLDVTDGHTDDRAQIQQWTCNGGGSEMWKNVAYNFGLWQYVNSRTSKCLDVPDASNSPEYVWQFHCTTLNTAQAFTFPS